MAATLASGAALADPQTEAEAAAERRPHAVYLELLGKGGAWGAGYDYQPSAPFAIGATVSWFVQDAQRTLALSPYLTGYPLYAGRNRLFVQLGPQLAHVATRSPVPEWPGTSGTELSGQLSIGWERRTRLLLRAYGMLAYGKGGFGPWLGVTAGWTF